MDASAERIGGGAREPLAVLAQAAHLTLTREGVLGGTHLDVGLGITPVAVLLEESTVAALEDVDLGVCEAGIVLSVGTAVLGAHVTGHQRGTVSRVLAVEDDEGTAFHRGSEEVGNQKVLVVVVDGAVDVATIVLVLEAAVDDELVIVSLVVLSIENVQQCLAFYARNVVALSFGKEMGQDGLGGLLNIHHRRESRGCWRLLLLGLHHLPRVLEHAQRAAVLLTWPHEWVRGPP